MMVARHRGCWRNWNSHGGCVCVCVCVCVYVHMYVCMCSHAQVAGGGADRKVFWMTNGQPLSEDYSTLFMDLPQASPSRKMPPREPASQLKSDLSQGGGTRPWQQGTELMLLWNTKLWRHNKMFPLKFVWKASINLVVAGQRKIPKTIVSFLKFKTQACSTLSSTLIREKSQHPVHQAKLPTPT